MKRYIIQTIEASGQTWYFAYGPGNPFGRVSYPRLATIFSTEEEAIEIMKTMLITYDLFGGGTIFIIIPIYVYGE